MPIVFYLGLTFTIFCVAAIAILAFLSKPAPEVQRVLEVSSVRPMEIAENDPVPGEEMRDRLQKFAAALRGRLGIGDNPKLNARLNAAGLRDAGSPDIFFAAQFLTPLVLAFGGSFISDNTVFWVIALAVVGYMAPDFWLTMRTNKRKERIRKSIPDAMDLLVICVDAGLGLDQAMLRVGSELAISHVDISQELAQVNMAQRAGQARLEAWQGFADRSKIEEIQQFVAMLTQTDRFGTPISKALFRFSEDLRLKRRQRAEEAAVKTKIKIIFPLVLCIFPCIFIVLLAPAILIVATGMKGVGGN
jgi:tight adherence protein C